MMFFIHLIHKAVFFCIKKGPQKKTLIPFQEQRLDGGTAEKRNTVVVHQSHATILL
jgi:hypothetical protein